jgi:hypothetical protein
MLKLEFYQLSRPKAVGLCDACWVCKPNNPSLRPTASPVYLAASAVNNLIRGLPAGTAYFIGVVLVTLFTGQLVQRQGSLARAALPYVAHLRWGWHRVEQAMARGSLWLDALLDRTTTWCLVHLPVEPVRLGSGRRTVHAIDSSTIARLRSCKASSLPGKGYWQRAQRAVRANLVAALTSVVLICGVRVSLVRRTRFGKSGEQAVAALFCDLPESADKRLFSVDAGIAPSSSLPWQPSTTRSSAGCVKPSLCAMRPNREDLGAAAGRRCMGRCCPRGQSGQKAAPMKIRRSRSKDDR